MKFSDKMSRQISERANKLSGTDDAAERSPSKGITAKITNYVMFILISEVCLGVYLHRYMDKQYKEIHSNFVHKAEIENYFLTLFESNGLKDELSAAILQKIRSKIVLSRTKRQNYVYMGCNCETKRDPLQSNPGVPPVSGPMVIPGPVGPPLGVYVDPNQVLLGNQRGRSGIGDLENDNMGFQPGVIGMQKGKFDPSVMTGVAYGPMEIDERRIAVLPIEVPAPQGPPSLTGEAMYPWAPSKSGQVNRNEPARLGLGVDKIYNPGPIGLQTERPASPPDRPFRSEMMKGFSEKTGTLQDGINSLRGQWEQTKLGVNVRPQREDTLSYPNSPLSTSFRNWKYE